MQENFNETPTEASSSDAIPSYLQGKDPNTPVMMYCTGGIRCDVYSAHLRDKGFNNLYTLEGGIQNYLKEEGHQLWDGSLFVFDGRMAVPSGALPLCKLAFLSGLCWIDAKKRRATPLLTPHAAATHVFTMIMVYAYLYLAVELGQACVKCVVLRDKQGSKEQSWSYQCSGFIVHTAMIRMAPATPACFST